MNVHCWIVRKVAPSNGALGVMSCVHLAQTCSHKILCFTCCLHEGRNAPWRSQGPQQKFKSPSTVTTEAQVVGCPNLFPTQASDVGELAICSTELVQRVPRLIDLEGCDDISSAVDHADTTTEQSTLEGFLVLWRSLHPVLVRYSHRSLRVGIGYPSSIRRSAVVLFVGKRKGTIYKHWSVHPHCL